MISLVSGVVRSLSADRVVVEVGGVGLSISITQQTSSSLNIGSSAQFFTSLIVREDSLTLFGFLDEETRQTFELVQTVSGIGPKVALAMMGHMTPHALAMAIAQEDVKAIEKVPGIGHKGAQRVILELKGKISDFSGSSRVIEHQPIWHEQLTSALTSLGFTAKESDQAVSTIVAEYSESGVDASTRELSELLKKALQTGRRN